MTSLRERVLNHRHGAFFAAAICALACLPFAVVFAPRLALVISAVAFFLIYLVTSAVRLPRLTAAYLKKHAETADEPAPVIFSVTLLAIVVSIVSLFFTLNRESAAGPVGITLAFASVVLGWLTIHTMTAMHYAHLYWRPNAGTTGKATHKGGLDFPGGQEPTGYDFLYFAFVIGMAAQTSDTAITTTTMRKVNLLHSVVSFFFNTVLVAAAVNAAVSMAS